MPTGMCAAADWLELGPRAVQRDAAYPGLEQPVQGDPARRLADLMLDRGLVAAGPTHEFLVQTLGNYVSSSSALQMLGRGARASAIPPVGEPCTTSTSALPDSLVSPACVLACLIAAGCWLGSFLLPECQLHGVLGSNL